MRGEYPFSCTRPSTILLFTATPPPSPPLKPTGIQTGLGPGLEVMGLRVSALGFVVLQGAWGVKRRRRLTGHSKSQKQLRPRQGVPGT